MKQTSLTHPLRIDDLNVPGTSGTLGMTLCPGKVLDSPYSGDWHRDLGLDLEAVRAWGASALVTLMETWELEEYQVPDLPARVPEGIRHFHLPIPDTCVPDRQWEEDWAVAGPQLRALLKAGAKVLVHGLGRTGLVAARLLVEFGMDPGQAILAVRRARPRTIENGAQERYVRRQKPVEAVPGRPGHPIPEDRASRFRGCLLGGAAGDALGAPVEFMDLAAIRAAFGPGGIRDLAPAYGRAGGAITDDTQMTLFTAEGILRGHVRGMTKGISSIPAVIGHAYQRWLFTQGLGGSMAEVGKDGWLLGHGELFARRAPGTTCVSALEAGGTGPRNQSKGCGGVMRVAPVGLYVAARNLPRRQAFTWGCEAAGLTHGHPTGQLPAGVLAMVICGLAQGAPLREALEDAKAVLRKQPDHGETLAAIASAESLAAGSAPADPCLQALGGGWVAHEALAIALFCALRAESLEEGVIMAANLTGDSDSTAAITGNILGALLGVRQVPARWLADLELRDVITELADDLATVDAWVLSDEPADAAESAYWWDRYPGW